MDSSTMSFTLSDHFFSYHFVVSPPHKSSCPLILSLPSPRISLYQPQVIFQCLSSAPSQLSGPHTFLNFTSSQIFKTSPSSTSMLSLIPLFVSPLS
ncbi:hypothetical protein XELAEV_18042180mg [Xenopus laevis]|uniref:Uncharacterized protein n=1 Tax=Xenopus laevis TaxID=8355 RepID=A0A974H5V1_XENLA|nr:hypothetical protein XELAEV_18042180mg [Xenopus laevis]